MRWVCMIVLGLAIGIFSPCHGYAATKHTAKKGTTLTKTKWSTPVGKSESKLCQASGKTSKKKAKSKLKKKQVRHATMKERVRAKKVKQARLIARHRPPRSGVARVRAADEAARNVEIPAMDLWQVKAYEHELAAQSDDRPVDENTLKIIESAVSYLGTPYRYGGTTPEGFDCSGFVRHVFGENGINLNRTSYEQFRQGKAIPLAALRPGDLIFFGKVKREHCRIEHVGLYIGEGRFIHAASAHTAQVKISELKPLEQRTRSVMARRILDYTP
ncbi:MAG: C40 family peptidase [Syntrophaceae bacterium]